MRRLVQIANLADAADEVLRLLGHNRPPLDEAAE
jgi:methylmalonyl-CoA mutase